MMQRCKIHDRRPDLKNTNVKALARYLKKESRTYPKELVFLPRETWSPEMQLNENVSEAWRSSGFLLQVYKEPNGIERLSIQRTRLRDDGEWQDKISWDELQRLKAECGRGDKQAIEIYPADNDVINVANLRHLWVLTEPMEFTWRKK